MTTDARDVSVPDELQAARQRRDANRARASRTLERSTIRRRVWPTVMVTSVALVGTGLANSFVGATLPVATTTTTVAEPSYASRQAALNAHTLAQLSATLAHDRAIVAQLTQTARTASATASSAVSSTLAALQTQRAASRAAAAATASTAVSARPANSTSAPRPIATTSTTAAASAPPPAPTPTVPVTAPPAPVVTSPPVAPPPTNATTGASGAG